MIKLKDEMILLQFLFYAIPDPSWTDYNSVQET